MQFAQFQRHEQGSSIVGFALVAPILVGIFLVVLQIANLVNVQTTLNVAAVSGARVASTFDGTLGEGIFESRSRLERQGITQVEAINATKKNLSGVTFVEIEILKNYQISWLQTNLSLRAIGRSVDEKSLWQK
jgi:hypothetical protein